MRFKTFLPLVVLALACQPLAMAQTQSNDVTFTVPLNLTQLPSYVAKVAVACELSPTPREMLVLGSRVELPVTYGRAVTTASVVVSVPADHYKAGQSVSYSCSLTAFVASPEYSGWEPFGKSSRAGPLDVSPVPLPITGSFVW